MCPLRSAEVFSNRATVPAARRQTIYWLLPKPLDGRNRLFNWRLVRDTRGKLSTDGCQPVLLHLGGLVLDLLTRRPCRPALRPGRRPALTTIPLPGYHS